MPAHGEIRLDDDPADPIGRRGERPSHEPSECAGSHAGRPERRARLDALHDRSRAHVDVGRADVLDPGPGADVHAQLLELLPRGVAKELGPSGEQLVDGLDQDDARLARVDRPELAAHRLPGQLGQRAGQLRPGRPAADHDQRHPLAATLRIGLALGGLEGQQRAPAHLGRVLEGLQARRVLAPLLVAEVRGLGAGGHDERVVVDARCRPTAAAARCAASRSVTSPRITRALRCPRSIARSGCDTSDGATAPVAAW